MDVDTISLQADYSGPIEVWLHPKFDDHLASCSTFIIKLVFSV